ncbi:MAG: hypothetical protein ACRDZ4_10930 [Egibacteraceae bacterium]
MKRLLVVAAVAAVLGAGVAYTATGGYCQRVRYCSVNCGELYRRCQNPVQRLICTLAHVLCRTGFGR